MTTRGRCSWICSSAPAPSPAEAVSIPPLVSVSKISSRIVSESSATTTGTATECRAYSAGAGVRGSTKSNVAPRSPEVCSTAMDFVAYVSRHLPPLPARVLEVGCGREGGVARELAAGGYDVLAIDPEAPAGPEYRRVTLEELDDPGPFDAVVAGRALHHIDPLAPALDKLSRLAPLLILD